MLSCSRLVASDSHCGWRGWRARPKRSIVAKDGFHARECQQAMKIVITGGAGFLGGKLAARLLQRGRLAGPDGSEREIDEILLFDMAPPSAPPADKRIRVV